MFLCYLRLGPTYHHAVQNCPNNWGIDKAQDHMERQEHCTQFQNQTDAILGHFIFLYACATWTLTAELERKIQTTEMRCFRRLLGISYRDHVTNEEAGNRIRQAIGPYEDLLTTVKKRTLRCYGHKTRSTGLAKMILQDTVQGGRRRGRQKKEIGRQRNGMDWIKVGRSPSKG